MILSRYSNTGVFEQVQSGRPWTTGTQQYRSISISTGSYLLRYSNRRIKCGILQAKTTISEQRGTAKEDGAAGKKVRRRSKTRKKEGLTLSSTASHGVVVKSTRWVDMDAVSIEIEVTDCGDDAEVDVLWYVASASSLFLHVYGLMNALFFLRIIRGVYRASPDIWQYPKAIESPDSCMDEAMNAMSTRMTCKKGVHSVSFNVPAALAPVTFAYVVVIRGDNDRIITPTKGAYFTTQIGVEPGSAKKLGSMPYTKQQQSGATKEIGINFAVECQGCDYVSLVLVKSVQANGEYTQQEIALDPHINRTGSVWHCAIPYSDDLVGYGWRVNGDLSWETNHRISPDRILLDPEAISVMFVDTSVQSLSGFPVIQTRRGEEKIALSGIHSTISKDTISPVNVNSAGYGILSVDTASFGHTMSDVKHPGTFMGIAEAAPYFASLGIASIKMNLPYTVGGSQNRAVSFFAPDPSLSSTNNVAEEFKSMTNTLHAIGIKVIISLDLTFTAEGSDEDPHVISWRGLDYGNYYRDNGVLNCGKPVLQEHIIRALRHWMLDLGVDGFEFMYAENMVQNMDDVVMDAPALPDALCHDPVLSRCMMIASPCNNELLPRQGARGFPHWGRWMEAHGTDSPVIRYFATPASSMTPSLAEKCALFISGQADLFSSPHHSFPGNLATRRPMQYSISEIDGNAWASTESLISTAASAARAAMIADGVESCLVTSDSLTRAILTTAIFSSGTPCIPHEAITSDTDAFVGECLTCRPVLSNVLDGASHRSWHAADGTGHASWEAMNNHVIGRLLTNESGSMYIVLNPEYHPVDISLPPVPGTWHQIVDSYSGEVQPAGIPVATATQTIAAKSVRVFTASAAV